MSRLRGRRGFTLVELLVVISIIGMLMALLLPAVQSAREAARRNTCSNNMRNVGMAMQNFENGRRYFPGYLNTVAESATTAANIKTVGYEVMLFPFIERNDLWKIYSNATVSAAAASTTTTATPNANQVYIELLNCPSNPAPSRSLGSTYNSYVVNGGAATGPSSSNKNENMADGISFNQTLSGAPRVGMDYLNANDGSSNTLMISENVQAWRWQLADNNGAPQQGSPVTTTAANDALYHHIFVWFDVAVSAVKPQSRINGGLNMTPPIPTVSTDMYTSRPSSRHPGGVNMFFAGGNLKFIAEDVDYLVYRQLMTPLSDRASNASGLTLAPLNDGSY